MAKIRESGACERMRRFDPVRAVVPLLVGVAAAGCSSDPAVPAERPQLAASVGAPVDGISITGPLPVLPNNQPNVEAGYMSTWIDLFDKPPMNLDDAWLNGAVGDLHVSANLAPQLRAAKLEVERRAEKARLKIGAAADNDVFEAIYTVFPYYKPQSGTNKLIAYTPERARWLMERVQNGRRQTFPDPYAFAEMRQRGARLYCAATAAYNRRTRGNRMMGKTMAAGVSILGIPLDLVMVEPTISMERPMRFDSGKVDGAQAFVVPFKAGVRVTPLSLFVGLPEVSVPVGFLTADNETVSSANATGGNYDKWMTMSHMDGFASVNQPYLNGETPDVTLMTIGGFVTVSAKLASDIGTAICSQADSYPACQATPLRNPGRQYATTREGNGPVQSWNARPGGWTSAGATGPYSYNNGPWDIDTASWHAIPRDSQYSIPTSLPDPLAGRMLQNNDKSLEVHTSAGMTLQLSVAGGYKIGDWLELAVAGRGLMRGGVNMVHRFREQEEMLVLPAPSDSREVEFNSPVPAMVTSFTVTPASQTNLTFGVTIGIVAKVNLPFLKKTFSVDAPPLDTTIGTELKEWPEQRRFRMDTAISDGKTASFAVNSHWPHGASYPSYEAWDQCQAPQTQPVEDDAPCVANNRTKPNPAQFQAIRGEICLWREEHFDSPDDPVLRGPDDVDFQCWRAMETWMQNGASRLQGWHRAPGNVLARVMQWDNQADMDAFHNVLNQCDALYGSAGRSDDFGNLLHFAFCDASAKLYDNPIEPNVTVGADPGYGPQSEPDGCD